MSDENKEIVEPAVEIKILKDDNQLKELTGDMPKVVQDAVDAASQAQKDEQDKLEKLRSLTDTKGTHFDPTIHAIDPKTGEPIRTPKFGKFKRKLKIPEGITPQGTTAAPTVDPIVGEARELTALTAMIYALMLAEEGILSNEERMSFDQIHEGIIRKYGSIPIGVEAKLIALHGAVIIARSQKPRTKSVINNIRLFFVNMYLKAMGKNEKIVSTEKIK